MYMIIKKYKNVSSLTGSQDIKAISFSLNLTVEYFPNWPEFQLVKLNTNLPLGCINPQSNYPI